MTMNKKQTIIFNRIEIAGNPSVDQVAAIMRRYPYDETEGLGFTNISIEDGIVYAKVLFRTPSYIQSYNEVEGLLEQRIVNVYAEIEIILDVEQGFLYASTSAIKFSKAKVLLRKCFEGKIIFRNIDVSPINIWTKISHSGCQPIVTDLSIKKYVYKEGAIGRFTVHIEEPPIGEELLAKYSDCINKITMIVMGNCGESFILSMPSQNSFAIRCTEEYSEKVINQLKKYL